MNIQQKEIIKALNINIRRISSKGWYTTDCPFCGKKEKFGVRFNDDPRFNSDKLYKNKVSFNCYAGSCGESGATNKLLKQLGLSHFISNIEYLQDKVEIKKDESTDIDLTTPSRMKPLFFKRIYGNEYLESRGFESWQFEKYKIGQSKKERDRVIFLIEEDGEMKGWVGRTILSQKEIEQQEAQGYYVPKYKNDTADFAKLLFGLDEVEASDTVILVEGVTDKANIDRIIRRLNLTGLKCCCTFGKKISDVQLTKLSLKQVGSIIFMYDPDAISESKKYSMVAQNYASDVKVALLDKKDPGEITTDEFIKLVENLKQPIELGSIVVNKVKLK